MLARKSRSGKLTDAEQDSLTNEERAKRLADTRQALTKHDADGT
jgi:hypothetical protein